jgi:hypothetical protein
MYNSGNSSKNVTGSSVVDGTLENADYADNAISGDKIDGGTISNFTSTGIDDNATSTAITIDASENVGIGELSPDELCHISAAAGPVIKLENTTTAVGDGTKIGEVQFYGNDTTGLGAGIKASIKAEAKSGDGRTDLAFYTTHNSGSNNVEKLRFTSNGYVRLSTDSLGIQFNGDTAAANALDDYEEGAWTPEFFEDGSAVSGYTVSSGFNGGWYTKIGNLVTFGGMFRLTNRGSPGSGDFQVGGLPYPTTNISPQGQSKSTTSIFIVKGIDNLASDESYQGSIQQNVSYIAFYAYDNSNGTHSSIVATDVQSDVYMQFSGSYQTT